MEDEIETESRGIKRSSSGNVKKKKKQVPFKKAPQAPKRFKSSYIYYSQAKHKEARNEIGADAKVTDVAKKVAQSWKCLSEEERSKWEEIARKDKERYMAEKEAYTGPWQVPSKRVKKDPRAPKRPTPAFLIYSQTARPLLRQKYPELPNTEISKRLGIQWKNVTTEEKKKYVEMETEQRMTYKREMEIWRKREAEEEKEKLKEEEELRKKLQSKPPVTTNNTNNYAVPSTVAFPSLVSQQPNTPSQVPPDYSNRVINRNYSTESYFAPNHGHRLNVPQYQPGEPYYFPQSHPEYVVPYEPIPENYSYTYPVGYYGHPQGFVGNPPMAAVDARYPPYEYYRYPEAPPNNEHVPIYAYPNPNETPYEHHQTTTRRSYSYDHYAQASSQLNQNRGAFPPATERKNDE